MSCISQGSKSQNVTKTLQTKTTGRRSRVTENKLLCKLDCLMGFTRFLMTYKCVMWIFDVARQQRLRSGSCHQLFVSRHRRSMFGRRAFSVAGLTIYSRTQYQTVEIVMFLIVSGMIWKSFSVY